MINKLENAILELEVKALNGANIWEQIEMLKNILKWIKDEEVY